MIKMIRRRVAVASAVLLALCWMWATTSAASAGGPTSVIMVNPESGRAAAVHTSNPRYQQLVDAMGAYESVEGSSSAPAGVPDCFECEIRLTWLIHDVQVWRIDRVHLTSDDGIWVDSLSNETGGDVVEQAGQWHRPHDAATLLAVLKAEGLTSTEADSTSPMPVSVSPAPAAAGADLGASVAGKTSVLRLGLVAVAAGVVGVLLGIGWWRFRSRSDRDRVELIG